MPQSTALIESSSVAASSEVCPLSLQSSDVVLQLIGRTRRYHLHLVLCYPFLVQRNHARPFPATRRLLVSNSSVCRTSWADTFRGAIGAWIKNVEGPPDDAVDGAEDGFDLSKLDKLNMENGHT
jgi:hypothetical protein